jgi:hypothetical protein
MRYPSFVQRSRSNFLNIQPPLPGGLTFELNGHIYPALCRKTASINILPILRDFSRIKLCKPLGKNTQTVFEINLFTDLSPTHWELDAEAAISSEYLVLARGLFVTLIKLNECSVNTQSIVKRNRLKICYTEKEFKFEFRTGAKETRLGFFNGFISVIAAMLDKQLESK